MIKSFRDKETQRLFMGRRSRAVSGRASRKLDGEREGQWAISVNEQYQICFRFEDGDAYDVEATDYH